MVQLHFRLPNNRLTILLAQLFIVFISSLVSTGYVITFKLLYKECIDSVIDHQSCISMTQNSDNGVTTRHNF